MSCERSLYPSIRFQPCAFSLAEAGPGFKIGEEFGDYGFQLSSSSPLYNSLVAQAVGASAPNGYDMEGYVSAFSDSQTAVASTSYGISESLSATSRKDLTPAGYSLQHSMYMHVQNVQHSMYMHVHRQQEQSVQHSMYMHVQTVQHSMYMSVHGQQEQSVQHSMYMHEHLQQDKGVVEPWHAALEIMKGQERRGSAPLAGLSDVAETLQRDMAEEVMGTEMHHLSVLATDEEVKTHAMLEGVGSTSTATDVGYHNSYSSPDIRSGLSGTSDLLHAASRMGRISDMHIGQEDPEQWISSDLLQALDD
jgi:hypothetical protein